MKLISYLKQIWVNRRLIWEGLVTWLKLSGIKEVIAIERINICNGCVYNSKNFKVNPQSEGELYPVPFKHCTLCGCSLMIKPYAMEAECPKKFWLSRKID